MKNIKTLFALLTVFLLSGIAVASADMQTNTVNATNVTGITIEPVTGSVYSNGLVGTGLTDSFQYKTTGLNSEQNRLLPRYMPDGILYLDGSFLEFIPLDEWRYVSGEGYVRNEGGTYTKEFGYGFFNWHPSYAKHEAEKAGKRGVIDTGFASITDEKTAVHPTSGAAKTSTCIGWV